jgi:hypothetical protein
MRGRGWNFGTRHAEFSSNPEESFAGLGVGSSKTVDDLIDFSLGFASLLPHITGAPPSLPTQPPPLPSPWKSGRRPPTLRRHLPPLFL